MTYKDKGSYEDSPPCTSVFKLVSLYWIMLRHSYSHVCHDSFICAQWLIHHESSHHWYMCHVSFICAPWLIRHESSITHICAMSHSSVCHDSFAMDPPSLIYVPWLIHLCAMTHSPWILHHSYMGHDSFICAPGLIHACCNSFIHALWHMHVHHESFIYHHVPWPIHVCHNTFTRAPWLNHTCVKSWNLWEYSEDCLFLFVFLFFLSFISERERWYFLVLRNAIICAPCLVLPFFQVFKIHVLALFPKTKKSSFFEHDGSTFFHVCVPYSSVFLDWCEPWLIQAHHDLFVSATHLDRCHKMSKQAALAKQRSTWASVPLQGAAAGSNKSCCTDEWVVSHCLDKSATSTLPIRHAA